MSDKKQELDRRNIETEWIIDETLGPTVLMDEPHNVVNHIHDEVMHVSHAESYRENFSPYTVDDVPEGEAGLEWLIQHRAEVFPWTEEEMFFDNGGAPPASKFYGEAIKKYYELTERYGYGSYPEIHKVREGREEIANLVNSQPEEIAFIPNTSTGINIVAQGIDWQAGDEIIVARKEKEFPSNYAAWYQLTKRGVKIIEIGNEEGIITPEEVKEKLSDRTRLISISSVGWKNGQRVDLESIGKIIQDHNSQHTQENRKRTLYNVDAIQSIGALSIDVKKAHIDFLEAGSSKWLLAEKGNGFFYCSNDAVEELPNAPIGSESLVNRDNPTTERKKNALGFEIGNLNSSGIFGLWHAAKLVNKVGIVPIEKRIMELSDYAAQKLEEAGFQVVSPRANEQQKSGILIFTKPEWENEKDTNKRKEIAHNFLNLKLLPAVKQIPPPVHKSFAERKVSYAYRDGRPRFSLHYYNTKEEIDEFIGRINK